MTPYEQEKLVILIEELAEAQKEACKCLRHGFNNSHLEGGRTNRENLEWELGDVKALIDILVGNSTLNADNIRCSYTSKPERMRPYEQERGAAPVAKEGK